MDLYLVRHGEARSGPDDDARPLSERGRRDVERVARALARAGVRVASIRHSGKLRARQTAEILARALDLPGGETEMAGLAPDDDPVVVREALGSAAEPTMLVGHLPHLNRLSALLLAAEPGEEGPPLRPGEVVSLRTEGRGWRLRWSMTPEAVSE